MSSPLTILPCSNLNILVQGDYDTYAKAMKRFSGRWNPRAKAGPGWLVPIEFESAVRTHFDIQDDTEAEAPTSKYRAAPKSKKSSHEPEPLPEEEQPAAAADDGSDKDHEPEPPATPPRSKAVKSAPSSKATPPSKVPVGKTVPASNRPVGKMATATNGHSANGKSSAADDSDKDDVVSLSRRMKEVLARLERLEVRKE